MPVAAAVPDPSAATITVNVFDGARRPFSDGQILITLRDGNQRNVTRDFHTDPSVAFNGLSVSHNFVDNFAVLASASSYKDAGFFPVKIESSVNRIVDLLLIPKSAEINFAAATWPKISAARPKWTKLLASEERYSSLMEFDAGRPLACLLNILTAMDQIALPSGTPLDYLREVIWDRTGPNAIAQDRFFAWADPAIVEQLKQSRQQGVFVPVPFSLHPGATGSFKQVQFGEANLQLTLHENDRKEINGIDCILIEPDIDYFKDPAAHLILEVAVNAFGSLTDPAEVYALRWTAGRQAGIPEFDPLYTIERA